MPMIASERYLIINPGNFSPFEIRSSLIFFSHTDIVADGKTRYDERNRKGRTKDCNLQIEDGNRLQLQFGTEKTSVHDVQV